MRYDIVKIDFPFISDKMSGKGVDRYCYTLSKGFEVLGLQFININGTNFKSYFSSHYKPLPDKMKEIRKIDGKVYHATTPFAWMLPYLTFKKRIVTTVHDIVPFFSNKNKLGINRRIANYMLIFQIVGSIYKSDIIITPFNFTKKWLERKFNIDSNKIIVVNYGIDPVLNNKSIDFQLSISRKHNFLFLGSFNPLDRGVVLALNAFRLFVDNTNDEYLVISMKSGTSQFFETVKLINSLRLRKRVKIIEFVPENYLIEFISKFRALLYPSTLGFSLLLMQSLAAGTPIITGNSYDIPEFLNDSGIHPIELDHNAFSKEMIKLISDSNLSSEVSKGLTHIKKFTSEEMCKRTAAIYNKLL